MNEETRLYVAIMAWLQANAYHATGDDLHEACGDLAKLMARGVNPGPLPASRAVSTFVGMAVLVIRAQLGNPVKPSLA